MPGNKKPPDMAACRAVIQEDRGYCRRYLNPAALVKNLNF